MFKTLLYLTASLLPLITARNIGFVDNGRGQVFLFKGGPTDWKRDANATLWAARPEMKDWDKDDRISVEETVKNEQERYGWSPWYLPKAKEGQSSEVKALYIDVDKDGRIKTPSGEYTFQIRYRNEKYGTLSGMCVVRGKLWHVEEDSTLHFGFRHSSLGVDRTNTAQRIKMMEPGCHDGITLTCSYNQWPSVHFSKLGDDFDLDSKGWVTGAGKC